MYYILATKIKWNKIKINKIPKVKKMSTPKESCQISTEKIHLNIGVVKSIPLASI